MKNLYNNVARSLDWEEHKALIEACQILEKAFKKRVFNLTVNPQDNNPTEVYGIALAFDLVGEI